jgi:hypothetical protein
MRGDGFYDRRPSSIKAGTHELFDAPSGDVPQTLADVVALLSERIAGWTPKTQSGS